MNNVDVLIEVPKTERRAFGLFAASMESESECQQRAESFGTGLSGRDLEIAGDFAPIPRFSDNTVKGTAKKAGFSAFSSTEESDDVSSSSTVIAASLPASKLEKLTKKEGVQVWPNSELTLFKKEDCGGSCGTGLTTTANDPLSFNDMELDESGLHPFDLAPSGGSRVDCRPFRPGVTVSRIRQLLSVGGIWNRGFRGQNIVVGIVDEGVNGAFYPVIGGFSRPGAQRPGSAPITSHGSMCAADVLVAAPAARLYDYPFLGIPRSGGALQMFQAVLEQRRLDGTPHITNNSYGFVGIPDPNLFPNHEVHDINHPFNRKVREVVASGSPTLFAAGNCGDDCPSSVCRRSGIGPGNSIHAANSLEEVITVAAVNSQHERIGYSSQGPGRFEPQKPDVSSYSHFFANFGPGRPGGMAQPFDNGTSAATPVAAGVVALLMSAIDGLSPADIKTALIESAIEIGPVGWDAETGHGIVNAGAAFNFLTSP